MRYPENTIATATVRGEPNTVVLRRKCFPIQNGEWHHDWAHTFTNGFTCSNDIDVTDVVILISGR